MHTPRSSRRHTPTLLAHGAARTLLAAVIMALVVATIIPAVATAQEQNYERALNQRWELLTYRGENGRPEPVPAGVGAWVLPFDQNVRGEAACSTFQASYEWPGGRNIAFRDITPEYVECDLDSRAFDELFYRLLESTASFELDGSILRLYDLADLKNPLMVLTSATIEDDPTVARWNLKRIASADGSVEDVFAGPDPWIEFLPGGSVVGQSGCGSFLGSYSILSNTMDISDVRFRMRDCPEPTLDQVERAITSLAEITNFEVRPAGLVLQDANGTTRLALEPDLELNGRTWTPTAVYDDRGELGSNALQTSAIRFWSLDADGASICRPFETEATRSGLALNVIVDPRDEAFDWRGDSCEDVKQTKNVNEKRVERRFMGALGNAASYALRGSELELKDVDGETIMRLEPQADLTGLTWTATTLNQAKPEGQITMIFDELDTDYGIIRGETGATDANGVPNDYRGLYELPAATRIEITNLSVSGDACRGKQARKTRECKQEKAFINWLKQVDIDIPKDESLQLRVGPRTVIRLEPQQLAEAQ
jgi:heat shock protein HslJ